jgi:hypothetical protein
LDPGYGNFRFSPFSNASSVQLQAANIPFDQISPSKLHVSVAFLAYMKYFAWRLGVNTQRVLLMRLTLLIIAALVPIIPAPAHSWYPLSCCGNMDCFPVACDQLVQTASGWLYIPTGSLFQSEQTSGPTLPCTLVPIARFARSSRRACSRSSLA